MGKLIEILKKQLKDPENKKDAEDCIKIYNWLKNTDKEGKVWDSRWTPLVSIRWEGTYLNSKRIYKPNITGYTLLKGIEYSDNFK